MNQLFKFGKSLFKQKKDEEETSGSQGFNLSNPMDMFKQLDKNGDGTITEEDFVLLVQSLGLGEIGEQAVHNAFQRIDKNQNGKIDFSEAMAALELVKAIFKKSETVKQDQEQE